MLTILAKCVSEGNYEVVAKENSSQEEKNCFGFVCFPEDYDKAKPPTPVVNWYLYLPGPSTVKVSPMLSELFLVNDNEFSISIETMVKLNWVDNSLLDC